MPLKHDFLIFTGTETQWHPWSISICTVGPIDEIQMTSWLTWSPPHTIHSILTHYLLLYSSWKGFCVISNNFAKTQLLKLQLRHMCTTWCGAVRSCNTRHPLCFTGSAQLNFWCFVLTACFCLRLVQQSCTQTSGSAAREVKGGKKASESS